MQTGHLPRLLDTCEGRARASAATPRVGHSSTGPDAQAYGRDCVAQGNADKRVPPHEFGRLNCLPALADVRAISASTAGRVARRRRGWQ